MVKENINLDAFSNVFHKGIIEVFLKDIELFKKQKYPLFDVDFGAFYIVSFAENGVNDASFFQLFVGLQDGVSGQGKL